MDETNSCRKHLFLSVFFLFLSTMWATRFRKRFAKPSRWPAALLAVWRANRSPWIDSITNWKSMSWFYAAISRKSNLCRAGRGTKAFTNTSDESRYAYAESLKSAWKQITLFRRVERLEINLARNEMNSIIARFDFDCYVISDFVLLLLCFSIIFHYYYYWFRRENDVKTFDTKLISGITDSFVG